MTFNKRIITAIATGAVLVNALAPIAFANEVTVSGNGALSNSGVAVVSTTNTVVNQTNNANITNNVSSNSSTGGNSSNFNTGGDSLIKTGNATNNVTVDNAANLNKASLSNCGTCNGGATNVTVSDNGAYTNNTVGVTNANEVFLNQNNDANFNNNIDANSNTGKNDSSFNTGGDTIIKTGDATTNVTVDNKANANIASIGGNGGNPGSSSVTIKGNGAFSDNGVALTQESAVVLAQDNQAYIDNNIDANAKTGKNDSQFNTGGFDGIQTGNATTNVKVDNLANFNSADINCDCVLSGLDAKVAGNGAESDNAIAAEANNALFTGQLNDAGLFNNVDGNAKTGLNDLGFSTGATSDPVILTGDSSSKTDVNNAGNVNVLDNGNSITLPGNWNVGVNFDLSGFLSFLSLV